MKKQEKQLGGDDVSVANADSPSSSPVPAARTSIASVVGGKKSESLFRRMGELLKAGCGTGTLAESTSVSKEEAVRTRICLSLGSGLSVLRSYQDKVVSVDPRPSSPMTTAVATTPAGFPSVHELEDEVEDEQTVDSENTNRGEGGEDKHHYNLLLRSQDLSRLMQNNGKIGIVTFPQTVGELTGMSDAQLQAQVREMEEAANQMPAKSGSSKSNKLPKRKKASSGAVAASSVAAKKAGSLVRLGVEARCFEVAVPRGKWTHIALVAAAVPTNKLTLYMVRYLKQKDGSVDFSLHIAERLVVESEFRL